MLRGDTGLCHHVCPQPTLTSPLCPWAPGSLFPHLPGLTSPVSPRSIFPKSRACVPMSPYAQVPNIPCVTKSPVSHIPISPTPHVPSVPYPRVPTVTFLCPNVPCPHIPVLTSLLSPHLLRCVPNTASTAGRPCRVWGAVTASRTSKWKGTSPGTAHCSRFFRNDVQRRSRTRGEPPASLRHTRPTRDTGTCGGSSAPSGGGGSCTRCHGNSAPGGGGGNSGTARGRGQGRGQD